MLEITNKYSIKEIGDLKDFITVTYILIDDIYKKSLQHILKNAKISTNLS